MSMLASVGNSLGDHRPGGREHLAGLVINHVELATAKSVGQLRKTIYDALKSIGLDVDRLRRDALMDRLDELQSKAQRARTKKPFYDALMTDLRARVGTFSHVPTPERVRQNGGEAATVQTVEDNGDPLRCDRHRFEWPVDRITGMISLEEYEAAKKCQWAYFASQGHARIGDYGGGVGGSDPSRRLGLTPEQEQAGRVWRVYWAAMNPVVKAIVLNFVLQQPPRGWDRPMTEIEFGREYGKSKHEATARGVAQGALRTACSVLREIEIAGGHTSWRDLQREVRARRVPARITNEEMAVLQGRERQLVRA